MSQQRTEVLKIHGVNLFFSSNKTEWNLVRESNGKLRDGYHPDGGADHPLSYSVMGGDYHDETLSDRTNGGKGFVFYRDCMCNPRTILQNWTEIWIPETAKWMKLSLSVQHKCTCGSTCSNLLATDIVLPITKYQVDTKDSLVKEIQYTTYPKYPGFVQINNITFTDSVDISCMPGMFRHPKSSHTCK